MRSIIYGIKDFDPDQTFDCGQCFRWERQSDGSYTGAAQGRVVNISYAAGDDAAHDAGVLTIDNCTDAEADAIWRRYLDLDRDYGAIKAALEQDDPAMAEAIRTGYGIRILRQDIWETLIHFIISQNNNIPRIKGCIESLCDRFGDAIGEYKGRIYHDMPSPERLASLTEHDIGVCRLGYRAGYIIKAARKVCDDGIDALETLIQRDSGAEHAAPEVSDEAAREYLMSFTGIGPKVADCIMLFGLGRMSSFPIDVWVRRVMNSVYGIDENDKGAMAEYAREHFGAYGGIAQQYLFHQIRFSSKKDV